MNEEKIARCYEKLKPFLVIPKGTNNLKEWNCFSWGDNVVQWCPYVPEGRVALNYYHKEWRRLTFKEFQIWYNAKREYLED